MSDERKFLSGLEAEELYGLTTSFELMPNGEFRSRMTPADGNGYIRTLASSEGDWQNAHSHKSLKETYIVQSGWIACAERNRANLRIKIYFPGDIFTTQPDVSHNIYMSANSVIHTVKHGGVEVQDWHKDDDLTSETRRLTEKEIIQSQDSSNSDERFGSYIDLYNNLDKLLWSVPNFLGLGGAVIIGFFGSILSREPTPDVPPIVFSGIFLFSSLLFFLGYASMSRLREHHSAVGDYLAGMEKPGYFTFRQKTVARRWPVSATLHFRVAYAFLSILLFMVAVAVLAFPSLLEKVLSH